MDSIRVPKVEGVACTKAGTTSLGTLHLTAHHLIFKYDDTKLEEMWVPYPLISQVNRQPQTLRGQCPLTLHCRTFESFSLAFDNDRNASDVFDSVKELTVAASVNQLYAFFYKPNPPLSATNGWTLYSPRDEFGRMGVGSRTKAWRFTDVNKDYSFCSTYPARLVVPTRISDTTLQYAAKYRSKARIPALTYLHWANYGSITRSSQPMVGLTQNRSIQDEKLIEAIFQSHHSPDLRVSSGPVYGATSTNLIIDARPTTNAMANTAKGAGTENMDHYKQGKKVYLGIDHIHVMRESLGKVVEALREADTMLASINNDLPEQISGLAVLDRQALRRSGWLRHISAILEGTVIIARNVHVNSSHVLIHCSDGWDRTSQMSALAQLCLDPFYRTIRGFEILIEKDWVSFGHKFLDRCGHLSSEKFFVSPPENVNPAGGAEAAQAFFSSFQNRFASQQHVKETSPVFHQFLEAVRQVQRQFPQRFEFNERFLQQLYYHLYSCQFGTFLYNTERERRLADGGPPPCEETTSVWDFFNSPAEMEKNLNPSYDPSLDDPKNRVPNPDMGVLLPNPKDVRFWNELYGKTDEEMNGRVAPPRTAGIEAIGPIESAQDDPVMRSATPSNVPLPPSPSMTPSASLSPNPAERVTESRSLSPRLPDNSPSELSTRLPAPIDRLRSYPSTSLSPSVPAGPSSSPSSSPYQRVPPRQSDIGSGVKSMWGKFSSNASAALSVVQDAYTGMAKDIRIQSGLGEDPSSSSSGSQSRELSGFRTEPRHKASPTPTATNFVASDDFNPWAAQKPRTPLQDPSENPWAAPAASVASRLTSQPTDQRGLATGLPDDPTVAHPLSLSSQSSSLNRSSTTLNDPPAAQVPLVSKNHESATPQSADTTDPLGVGFIS
ncbi:hypothetical protein HGRIS_012943 [Hohenbuehelia grisea]|uniref:Myotubularin phosphatase domain-containing protein n=1 Tax=Hohenbuehelia grisea TaxID=104357 RepID=A0ABR3IU42_9AGAR